MKKKKTEGGVQESVETARKQNSLSDVIKKIYIDRVVVRVDEYIDIK